MKITKTLTLFALILALLLALTACGDERYEVQIDENGGSIKFAWIVSKEDYEDLDTSSEEYAQMQAAGFEVESCTIDGEECCMVSLTQTYDSLEALSEGLNALSFWAYGAEETEETISYLENVCVSADKGRHTLSMTGSVVMIDPEYCNSCLVTLHFPGTITGHNIGTKLDDTTLEIDLLEIWQAGSETDFAVTARLPGAYVWLYVLLGVCLILGAGGGFLLYRKRRSAQAAEAPEETSENAAPCGEDAQPQEADEAKE